MPVMRLDRVRACNICPPYGGQSVKRLLTKYLIRRHKLAESPQPPRIRLLSLREKRSGSGNATSIPHQPLTLVKQSNSEFYREVFKQCCSR